MFEKIKSKDKYSYKSFTEWLKTKKARKRLLVIAMLLFIIGFSFFPYWLVEWDNDKSIDVELEWNNGLWIYGDNYNAEGIEVRLYDGLTLIDTTYSLADGTAQFFVDEFLSTYEVRIYHRGMEAYTLSVVDIDADGRFDLLTQLIQGYRLEPSAVFMWQGGSNLVNLTDIDVYMWNGTAFELLGTFTTQADGTPLATMDFIYGTYRFAVSGYESVVDYVFDSDTTSMSFPTPIYIESIFMLISSIGIISLIIWKESHESQIIVNKSVRNLRKKKETIITTNRNTTETKKA